MATILDAEKMKLFLAEVGLLGKNYKQSLTLDDGSEIKIVITAGKKKRKAKFGSAKGKVVLAEDFDAPIEDFEEYMK